MERLAVKAAPAPAAAAPAEIIHTSLEHYFTGAHDTQSESVEDARHTMLKKKQDKLEELILVVLNNRKKLPRPYVALFISHSSISGTGNGSCGVNSGAT